MNDEEMDQDLDAFKEQFGGRPQDNRGAMTILVFKSVIPLVVSRGVVIFIDGVVEGAWKTQVETVSCHRFLHRLFVHGGHSPEVFFSSC